MTTSTVFQNDICQNRVVIVTGGGSGIGCEIAKQFAQHGAKVMLMGRRQEKLQDTVAEFRQNGLIATFCAGDVRNVDDANRVVDETIKAYGHVDTLINSAAGNFLAVAEELSLNGFRTVLDIDTCGTFNMCRAVFQELKQSGRGKIINISATLHYSATWYQVHASAAKAGIDSLTRSLALEWGSYGIRVTGIAPGPTKGTPGLAKLAPEASDAIIDQLFAERIPLQRAGTTTEIASAALFLASSAGDFITGHTLVVDGGEHLSSSPLLPRELVAHRSRAMETPKL